MKRKILISIAIAGGALFLFLGALCLSLSYPFISSHLTWRDIRVQNLQLKEAGPKYSIADGKLGVGTFTENLKLGFFSKAVMQDDQLIRLALFYQINKENPLFSGPGLDEKEYAASIESLAASHDEFKKTLNLSLDLYPIEYFKKTVVAGKAAETFQASPSIENAKSLIKADREAVKEYGAYTSKLKSKLADLKLPATLFAQEGGITSRDIILSDLDKTLSNASKLNAQISSRENCLLVSTLFCSREPLKVFPSLTTDAKPITAQVFPAVLDKFDTKMSPAGPYQINTACWRPKAGTTTGRLLYALTSVDGKMQTEQPADNIYFQEVTPEQYGQALYDQYIKHGINWEVLTLNSAYTCGDMEYQPTIATLNAYFQKYSKVPLLSNINKEGLASGLIQKIDVASKFEQKFAQEKYPSDASMYKLAASYAGLYNYLTFTREPDANGSIYQLKNNLLERFNFINLRLADYPKLLDYLSFRTESHSKMSEVNIKGKTEQDYIYFMRNSYALTLMGFSPAVWQESSRLQYLSKDTKISDNLLDYATFVKKFGIDYFNKVEKVGRYVILKELEGKN